MIKIFEVFRDVDPYDEEDWDENGIQAGDTVICINDKDSFRYTDSGELKLGHEYTVLNTNIGNTGEAIFKIEIPSSKDYYWYYSTRFKKKI